MLIKRATDRIQDGIVYDTWYIADSPCISIKTIYPTQTNLLLICMLFSVFFAKIHSLVLSPKDVILETLQALVN